MKKRFKIFLICLLFVLVLASLVYIFFEYLPEKREKDRLIQEAKNYYAAKLEQYESENKNYAPGEVDIVFLGDSLTDGYDIPRYYPEYLALNRGIGGDTTVGLEERLDVSVFDVQPKVVVMLIGANNMNEMFDNYEKILIALRDNLPNSKIVLVSLTSMGQEWGRKNQLAAFNNVKIKALAEKYGYSFVDVYTPLLNLETNEIYPEYTTDGGHLTPLGYQVLTNAIKPTVDVLLKND